MWTVAVAKPSNCHDAAGFAENEAADHDSPVVDANVAFVLCQGSDGAGHILLECTYADMKKQHIARHDGMMKMLIKEFTNSNFRKAQKVAIT